jgi:carboxyl-terminal processing protease
MIKKILPWISAIVILLAVFISGVFTGYTQRPEIDKVSILFNKELRKPAEIDFSPFWQSWNIIEEKYVSNNGLDRQNMVWGAISGLADSLGDPYTEFFPPAENEVFKSEVKGEFGGVGMEIGMRKGMLTVIAPLKGTPAYKAGLKSGDKILKIDGKETADVTLEEAVRLIRGKVGTAVKLTILSEDAEDAKEVKIIRDIIQIPVIDTEAKPDGIFIIKLYSFSEKSIMAFRGALREMINSKSSKLILDLRSNPGGYLESAVDIASWFLPLGKIVAREQFSNKKEKLYRSKGYDIFNNLPMVILVNKGSASASEILAGALQDHKIATIVGEKTFGKGSVQELIPITEKTSLKITIARWLTPEGSSISEKGLTPDIEIKLTKEDIEDGKDPQMEKALELLR